MSQLFQELKRRNVFRVAIAYLAASWLILQVVDLVLDNVTSPPWIMRSLLLVTAVGFPIALLFAWAYEVTPEGVKRESEIDRSSSITGQTGRKLNRVITVILSLAVVLLLVDKFAMRDPAVAVTDKSVAVLPFVAMSSGPDDEYFADGLTEEILNSLTQLSELLVTARTSAFSFKGQDLPIPQIAAKLGVAHIVEGSVRRAGDEMRITAQLIRASDGFHLWSETYDRSGANNFGVQAEIAEKIASALDVVLDEDQRTVMRSTGLRSPGAFIAYQKGLELYAKAHEVSSIEQPKVLAAANRYFEQTLELEPEFSNAYFGHADLYIHSLADSLEVEISDADAADALDNVESDLDNAARYALTEGQRLSAKLESAFVSGQWRRIPDLVAAIVESSDCITPAWWSGAPIVTQTAAQALTLAQRIIDCDPLRFSGWVEIAEAYNSLGEFQNAIDIANQGLASAPHRQIRSELITAYIALGQLDEAESLFNSIAETDREHLAYQHVLAAARGDVQLVARLLDEQTEKQGADAVTIKNYAISGDRGRANQRAAALDALPYGLINLNGEISGCYCGAPFDLEVAPNFAHAIEEAEMPWPPPSSINWPLKDW